MRCPLMQRTNRSRISEGIQQLVQGLPEDMKTLGKELNNPIGPLCLLCRIVLNLTESTASTHLITVTLISHHSHP